MKLFQKVLQYRYRARRASVCTSNVSTFKTHKSCLKAFLYPFDFFVLCDLWILDSGIIYPLIMITYLLCTWSIIWKNRYVPDSGEKRKNVILHFLQKKFLRHVSTYVQPILDSHHHRINRFFLDIRRIIGFIYLQFVERYQAIRKSKDVQVECLKK